MALYAFDGTWNQDKDGTERDTNVVWFDSAYVGESFYQPGVGTKLGKTGKLIGGITGAGGRTRVKKAMKRLRKNFEEGDTTIDIVGFSRGAALALHFANKIASKGVETSAGKQTPKIRFLGLWDTVAAFGAPDIPANVGWKLKLPRNVEHCFHALALDERRHAFKPERLIAKLKAKVNKKTKAKKKTKKKKKAAPHLGVVEECWFRGVHSDVGGGNKNPALSSIALDWMFAKAQQAGVTLDSKVVERNRKRIKPEAKISVHKREAGKSRFRKLRQPDPVHETVTFRPDSPPQLRYNNPADGAALVSNSGEKVGDFRQA